MKSNARFPRSKSSASLASTSRCRIAPTRPAWPRGWPSRLRPRSIPRSSSSTRGSSAAEHRESHAGGSIPLNHAGAYFDEVARIARAIPIDIVEALVDDLVRLRRDGGRLFLLGVGGSAANCSHAVNDFRKLCGIEAYAPTDNVAQLTARTNDD